MSRMALPTKLPFLPDYAMAQLPAFMANFFLGRIVALVKEHPRMLSEAEHVYATGWADALRREPGLFERLVAETDWKPGFIQDNHKKAVSFFEAEAQTRGTTVHHMLFGFPVEFDEWFNPGNKGGDRDAPAERNLLLKFLLRDEDVRVVRALYEFQDEPLAAGQFLDSHHFQWVRSAKPGTKQPTSRNFLRAYSAQITHIEFFDLYIKNGISVDSLRRMSREAESVVKAAVMEGVGMPYAAQAAVAGVWDIDTIFSGFESGVPVEYLKELYGR